MLGARRGLVHRLSGASSSEHAPLLTTHDGDRRAWDANRAFSGVRSGRSQPTSGEGTSAGRSG